MFKYLVTLTKETLTKYTYLRSELLWSDSDLSPLDIERFALSPCKSLSVSMSLARMFCT